MMSKLSNSYQKINNNVAVYRALVSAINDGIVLSPDQITEDICDYDTLGYDLTALVNACNDLICSNGGNTNTTSEAYSTIQQENSQLKKELQEIKQQHQTLIEEKKTLEEESEKNKQIVKIFTNACEEVGKIK